MKLRSSANILKPSEKKVKIKSVLKSRVREKESPKTEKTLKENLEEIYSNVASTPSFSAKINDFLRQHKTQGTHKRILKKRFPRRRIIVRHPRQIFMADLIEYSNGGMARKNNGYVYILLVIDCFSKFVWTKSMKNKDGLTTAV
jgi:hypothetical protein